jgi:hypothetical protein
MTHSEDEDTADAQTSADEDSQASADEDTEAPQASADEDTTESQASADEDSQASAGQVEDRGAGETSGMEDIRMVAAAIEESHQIHLSTSVKGEDEDDLLPGAVGGFGSIAGAALVRGPAQRELVQRTSEEEPASKAKPLLFGAIVVLVVAIGGLSWAITRKGDEQERADDIAAAQLSAAEKGARRAASLDLQEERDRDDDSEQGDNEGEPSEKEPASDPGDEAERGTGTPATDERARGRRRTSKKPRPSEPTPAGAENPPKKEEEPKPEEPPAKKAEELGADCILNPDLPECQDASKKKTKKIAEDDPRADLPEKLTKNDVRAGFGAVKSKAKACGAEYGVDPGTKVRVKVSISGETGLVISATALGEHADEPVGKCVAEALSKAKFGQFRKSVMGVTYPVTL